MTLADTLATLDAMLADTRQMLAEIKPRDPASRAREGDQFDGLGYSTDNPAPMPEGSES